MSGSWVRKFAESLVACIAIVNPAWMLLTVFMIIFEPEPGLLQFRFILIIQAIIVLLSGGIFSVYWHSKERRKQINSGRVRSWFYGIVRYWLAFSIATYGFAKIMKTQFNHAYYTADTVMSKLSGFELTWGYFSHSYALAVIIGLCQITGSALLLFRRTTLLAVFILLPVMINIVLINVFFSIEAGAFINSIAYTAGLLYLLSSHREQLRLLFFRTTPTLLPVKLVYSKYLIRIMTIASAFAIIYVIAAKSSLGIISGKWKVEEFIRNGDTVQDNSWMTDHSVWKNVYIEDFGSLILSPNPYIYDPETAQWSSFKYDPLKQELNIFVAGSGGFTDTMNVHIVELSRNRMQWSTIFKKDTLVLKLSKAD